MKIVKYNQSYQPILAEWAKERKYFLEPSLDFAENGLVAVNDDGSIAAGFLRMIEGGGGFLDMFITNPKASSELRHLALDLISENLMKLAKEMKLQFLMLYTIEPNIRERAEKHQFKLMPHQLMGRSLKRES